MWTIILSAAVYYALQRLFEGKASPELKDKLIAANTPNDVKNVLIEEGTKELLAMADAQLAPIITDLAGAKDDEAVEAVIANPTNKKNIFDLLLTPIGGIFDLLFGKKK